MMARALTNDILTQARWGVGQLHLLQDGGKLTIVGRTEKALQMAQRTRGQGEKWYVVREYRPENIFLTDNGGCVERAVPSREITAITMDEYFGKVEPSGLNKEYVEVLRKY